MMVCRELIYRIYEPEPVNEYLQGLISSKNIFGLLIFALIRIRIGKRLNGI